MVMDISKSQKRKTISKTHFKSHGRTKRLTTYSKSSTFNRNGIFDFLGLPGELRIMVYEWSLLLSYHEGIPVPRSGTLVASEYFASLRNPIAALNRQVREEFLPHLRGKQICVDMREYRFYLPFGSVVQDFKARHDRRCINMPYNYLLWRFPPRTLGNCWQYLNDFVDVIANSHVPRHLEVDFGKGTEYDTNTVGGLIIELLRVTKEHMDDSIDWSSYWGGGMGFLRLKSLKFTWQLPLCSKPLAGKDRKMVERGLNIASERIKGALFKRLIPEAERIAKAERQVRSNRKCRHHRGTTLPSM
ncbi:hypothetical protein NA57DRAFT_60904 [Rhizodiscina lignyota]|uniref:Uncharacterized protein n=1 Tax=Rhizodiscina lignyota TaxID=1504668 RepID=A0A9P4M244_9PEZI|nr:hypothetical protein NA57DRAFT_60904 [Rhizodiscina lignyota]